MNQEAFQIIVLGCTGGPREGNISGYLLSPLAHQEWIALDAGSLLIGIEKALEKNSFKNTSFLDTHFIPSGEMLIKHIRCFLISHAHLDHIAGLVLNSQIDEKKSIVGIESTIDNLRDHIFNGKIWPNYGNEGLEPILNKYHYVRVPLFQTQGLPNTTMSVEAYPLSHPNGYPSSAFLIDYKGDYLLYLGDTSSDFFEKEKHLKHIWERITPLLKKKKLHALFLECSYSQKESEYIAYGHLDTQHMMKELHALSRILGETLQDFKVIVTHRKESLKQGMDALANIQEELLVKNDLGIQFIFPTQGDRIVV